MQPILEIVGVALLSAFGAWLGWKFSRLEKPYWFLGYLLPFLLLVVYGLSRYLPALSFVPPISWMMMGRTQFAIIGFVTAMILTTPLSRLPRRRDRRVVTIMMVLIVLCQSIWPFVAPMVNRSALTRLKTRLDADGICLQSTDYNCGPAAAVTGLRRLGINAEEGEIALLARCNSGTGTQPDILARALRKRYADQDLKAEYRYFRDLSDLKMAGLTLVIVKFTFLVDHYLVVLEMNDDEIIVGDPLSGKRKMSLAEFKKIWRKTGVVLKAG